MNANVAKLLAEIELSNNAVLDASNGRQKPSEEGLGLINNNACDVNYYLQQLKKLLESI